MSVRRLADAAVQPAGFRFDRANAAWAKQTIKKYPKGREQSAVIPLLMRAQEQEGWVTRAAIEHVSDMLDMPLIRVLEVATFYTQFQLKPVGARAHIQVCGTTPCMLRGSEDLMKVCKRRIAEHQFETNADGMLSWEEVECLGACVNAPMVMIFKDTYEDLTPKRLEEIIDEFEAGRGDVVPTGPQNGRTVSAPAFGLTSLTEEILAGKANGRAKPSTARIGGGIRATAKNPAAKQSGSTAENEEKNRPAAIKKPARPDDLQLLSGVGPKLEGALHDLGIYTFRQLASWKKSERDWVDHHLKFKGRIERDDWVRQAKALANGGVAEYARVFGKKPK